jgi:hypothetical protein
MNFFKKEALKIKTFIRRGGKTVFLQFHCTIQYACIHYVVQNGGLFLEIFLVILYH